MTVRSGKTPSLFKSKIAHTPRIIKFLPQAKELSAWVSLYVRGTHLGRLSVMPRFDAGRCSRNHQVAYALPGCAPAPTLKALWLKHRPIGSV